MTEPYIEKINRIAIISTFHLTDIFQSYDHNLHFTNAWMERLGGLLDYAIWRRHKIRVPVFILCDQTNKVIPDIFFNRRYPVTFIKIDIDGLIINKEIRHLMLLKAGIDKLKDAFNGFFYIEQDCLVERKLFLKESIQLVNENKQKLLISGKGADKFEKAVFGGTTQVVSNIISIENNITNLESELFKKFRNDSIPLSEENYTYGEPNYLGVEHNNDILHKLPKDILLNRIKGTASERKLKNYYLLT